MIRNRLAEILFEREIKIVRIAKETGISRNTITNTASNNSEMLQMNTINKICSYLKITPCDFFDYIPIDIDFSFYENSSIDIVNDWKSDDLERRVIFDIDLLLDIDFKGDKKKIDTKIVPEKDVISTLPFIDNEIKLSIQSNDGQLDTLMTVFNEIPKEFKKIIYHNLINEYKSFLLKHINEDEKIDGISTKSDLIVNANYSITNSFLKYY
ncbi:TPA: helix-turn-helix domain-containing protein [Staphylococcus aureus]|nr:helix-turn-helix transcriptional regulator [Staphylococcus aureus]EKF1480684.1 helix-turn-helix transcriptional regulator [Staphylococcus aureus]ELK6794076.1 helix-turn-helix transcriptional regulator [Staphylococcus aureus]MBU4950448.1 helix-turn-helix transcriptional regulator [Staphylococcus aureus]MBU4954326.1 helix-turn-helix transcriptional regulator [Staphylococcus aureus]MCQ1414959.1 helix-turn-helix transcriptional regulator [Staphylococcus aureus]